MKRQWVQCPQCLGRGEIPMPATLQDTLEIVTRSPKINAGLSAYEVHCQSKDSASVKLSAINNRLVKLETLGYVTRTKKGKTFYWKAVGKRRKK